MTESNAIAYYTANEQLRGGKDAWTQAQVWQWASFADSEVLPPASTWVFPMIGIMPYDKEQVDRAIEEIGDALYLLNKQLTEATFLVGERITLADIIVFTTLLQLFEYVLDPSERKKYVALCRWFNTMLNQKEVKAVITEKFKFCEKPVVHNPKLYDDFQRKIGFGLDVKLAPAKKEKAAAKKEEKKAAPAKKEEKKAAAPAEELDATELALRGEPESKDPFAALPAGKWVIDDFKRFYSNEDESKSIPYFWEKFDPEHYSIWFGEYKYNEELTKVFMSCNLISGMFQRLDKMRKQSFASVCLFGEDNNNTISGVWVWRGQDLAFKLSPDWQVDYEVYDWKKLDANAAETKALVAQYFSWTGTDKDGRKFNQGKVFK